MHEIRCPEHLEKAKQFAATLERKKDGKYDWHKPPADSLNHCLDRYKDDDNKLVILMEESQGQHNFYFHVYTLVGPTDKPDTRGLGGRDCDYVKNGKEWKFWYNGGIIFHDYSNNWSIHT